jgi:hypothetical protein
VTDHIARVYAEGTTAWPIPTETWRERQEAMPSNGFTCHDGFTFSLLAGVGAHCIPSPGFTEWVGASEGGYQYGKPIPIDYAGPYVGVELGFPSARPEPWSEWEQYADSDDPLFLYGNVPERMVRALVELHGGEFDPFL